MPRPTRTRRMRGAPSAEIPHPKASVATPTLAAAISSASSDIYSATPPPAPDTANKENEDTLTSKRSARKHSSRRGRSSRRDTSGLDLNEDVFDDLDSDLDLDMEDTEVGGNAVPASANTSTISISQFKRRGRSRKPSFAGSDSGHIRPGSRGVGNNSTISSAFNIGLFRRRAREPSIIDANRRKRAGSVATTNSDAGTDMENEDMDKVPESDGDLEELDDFRPDAISTPVNKWKSQRQATPEVPDSAVLVNPRKRKSLEGPSEEQQADKIAKLDAEDEGAQKEVGKDEMISETQQSPEVEIPALIPPSEELQAEEAVTASEVTVIPAPVLTQEPVNEPSEAPIASIEIPDDDDSLSDLTSSDESLLSPLSARVALTDRPITPQPIREEDLAPPMSGVSSEGSPVAWPSIHNMTRRRRPVAPTTPIRARGASEEGGSSPLSSPPSLTHSPNYATTKQKKKTKAVPQKVLTAELQSLLPQRRTRTQGDVYEIEDEGDEDVLTRSQGHRAGSRPRSRAGTSTNNVPIGDTKTLAQRKRMQFEPNRRISRTYGSNKKTSANSEKVSVDDQEVAETSMFEALADDTFTPESQSSLPEGLAKSVELKEAKKKFKEVDKWEMEFEEVPDEETMTDGR